jgi:sugar lactone lactonase YvrE
MRQEMHSNADPLGAPAELADLKWTASGLQRPECVLATAQGSLYTADWRGGVAHIRPDGSQTFYAAQAMDGEQLKPNGIALCADGSFLLAHLGAERGGVFSLCRDGQTRPWLVRVDGLDLPPTNFAVADAHGRVWITVSTRRSPRSLGYRADCDDGFIVVVDAQGPRIVADDLGYTNECLVDASGAWLYVNETFGRRLSRFAIGADGSLGPRDVVCEFGPGTFPDGLAQDVDGGFWITSIVSNRLIRVMPGGQQQVWLEDSDPEHLAWVEQAYRSNEMGRSHLDGVKSRALRNISSLAFGGPDLRTGYLGCLLGDALATLRMPVAGVPPIHWKYP